MDVHSEPQSQDYWTSDDKSSQLDWRCFSKGEDKGCKRANTEDSKAGTISRRNENGEFRYKEFESFVTILIMDICKASICLGVYTGIKISVLGSQKYQN